MHLFLRTKALPRWNKNKNRIILKNVHVAGPTRGLGGLSHAPYPHTPRTQPVNKVSSLMVTGGGEVDMTIFVLFS